MASLDKNRDGIVSATELTGRAELAFKVKNIHIILNIIIISIFTIIIITIVLATKLTGRGELAFKVKNILILLNIIIIYIFTIVIINFGSATKLTGRTELFIKQPSKKKNPKDNFI